MRNVLAPKLNPDLTAVSKQTRWSAVLQFLQKPTCCLGIALILSKSHCSLALVIFSNTFDEQDVRGIGRYESTSLGFLPVFNMGVAIAVFELDGTKPWERNKLKSKRMDFWFEGKFEDKFFSISLGIRSEPNDQGSAFISEETEVGANRWHIKLIFATP